MFPYFINTYPQDWNLIFILSWFMFFYWVIFVTLQLKLYFLWFFLTWVELVFMRNFNLYNYNILTIKNLSRYWVPRFKIFYTIFVTNKDTFFNIIIQLTPIFLCNMHTRIATINSNIIKRELYQSMPHVEFCQPVLKLYVIDLLSSM